MFKTIAMENIDFWMPIMTNTYKHFVTDEFWYYEGKLSSLERLKAGVTTGVSVLGTDFRHQSCKSIRRSGNQGSGMHGSLQPSMAPFVQQVDRWKESGKGSFL
jgi:cytosine/adenosine deaminase-related metal-dependent hydrolase